MKWGKRWFCVPEVRSGWSSLTFQQPPLCFIQLTDCKGVEIRHLIHHLSIYKAVINQVQQVCRHILTIWCTNLISKFSVKSSLSLGRNGINCSWVEVQAKVDSCCWIRLRKRIVCVHVDAFILWPDVHALGWLVSVPDSWLNSAPTRTSLRINDPQSWMHFWSNASHYSISWQLGV